MWKKRCSVRMRIELRRKKKGKNPFEASMLLDNPDIKLVEARYKNQPFFFGVGASKQRELRGAGEVMLPKGFKGEYQSQKDLKWNLYFNPKALPNGFMLIEKLKGWMAGTVSATSGSVSVFSEETKFIETEPVALMDIDKIMEEIADKIVSVPNVTTEIFWGDRGYRIVTEGGIQRLKKIENGTIDLKEIKGKKKKLTTSK